MSRVIYCSQGKHPCGLLEVLVLLFFVLLVSGCNEVTLFRDAEVKTVDDYDIPFNKVTRVTAHNAFEDNMASQLERGVRGFMLDLHYGRSTVGPRRIMLCHASGDNPRCADSVEAKFFADEMNNIFIPFLKANPNEVITIHLEVTVSREDLKKAFKEIPDISTYAFKPQDFQATEGWPTLREMIDKDQRLLFFVDVEGLKGEYLVSSDGEESRTVYVFRDKEIEVQNGYDLGWNALDHDWSCKTRWGAWVTDPQPAQPCTVEGVPKGCPMPGVPCEVDPVPWGCPIPELPGRPIAEIPLDPDKAPLFGRFKRLFIMNQFHAFMKSEADAGNIDNNLTYLERRVERYCKSGAGREVIPNEITIDYTNVGDATPYAKALTYGGIYFYEQNNANRNGDTVCVLPRADYNIRLASKGCENDEARSMELRGLKAGMTIVVSDSPDANHEDDFAIIRANRDISLTENVVVSTFEKTENNEAYSIRYFGNNGLDGKVSHIKVEENPVEFSEAAIVLKEGINGTQNTVCTVATTKNQAFDFGGACDNDEAQSGVLTEATRGTTIDLFGNWAGKCDQGCVHIQVKRDIKWPKLIRSFEESFEDEDVRVVSQGGEQLNGKISSIKVIAGGDYTPPSTPVLNPEPTHVGEETATLTWGASSDNVGIKTYKVVTAGTLKVEYTSSTSHVLTGLKEGSSNTVTVSAIDLSGNMSSPATIVFNTLPAKPTNVKLSFSGKIGYLFWTYKLGKSYELWVNGVKLQNNGVPASFRFDEVPGGPVYTAKIRALFGVKASDFVEVSKTSTELYPGSPGDPVFTNITESSATVNWAPSIGNGPLAGYGISLLFFPLGMTQGTSYQLNGLASGTDYAFTVSAKNVDGNWSPVKSGSFKTLGSPPGSPPKMPKNLRITPKAVGAVELAWDSNADDGVFVYAATLADEVRTLFGNLKTTYNNLVVGEEYTFKVRAYDLWQRPSEPANLTVIIPPPPVEGAPRNFRYVQRPGGLAQVDVSWDPPEAMDVDKYNIVFDGGGGAPVVKEPAGTKLLILLKNATTYKVSITAHNETGESPALEGVLTTK